MKVMVKVKAFEEIEPGILKAVTVEETIECDNWSDALEYAKGIKEVTFENNKYKKREISCFPVNLEGST